MIGPNPVANALMTKMKFAKGDRPRVKLECLRMMATLRLDPARTELIGAFMRSYLTLTPPEEIVYNRESDLQKRSAMQDYGTINKELALADGLAKGRAEVIVRQLRRLFDEVSDEVSGEVSDEIHTDMWRLNGEKANQLADAFFDFKRIQDVKAWLANAHTIPPQ